MWDRQAIAPHPGMKKGVSATMLVLVMCVLASTLTACSSTNVCDPDDAANVMIAQWPYYETLGEALDRTSDVIVGEYLDSELRDDPQGTVSTSNRVLVVESLRGDLLAGETIVVVQDGGVQDGVFMSEAYTTPLECIESPQIALLLSKGDDGDFYLINPFQGLLRVDGGTVEPLDVEGAFTEISTLDDLRGSAAAVGW